MTVKEAGLSWNKIITLCSAFGIPLISILAWLIVSGTQLVDTVHAMSHKQDQQDVRMDKMDGKIDKLIERVDTVANHQYRYTPKPSRYNLYIQKKTVNGVEWVPYRP